MTRWNLVTSLGQETGTSMTSIVKFIFVCCKMCFQTSSCSFFVYRKVPVHDTVLVN